MNLLKLPLACLLILSTALAIPVAGQQKRRTPDKPAAKTPAAPAPAPVTLDTLLAADSFKIYGEVRGVGQLVRSNVATEVLDPILRFGGPSKEFSNLVNWLKTHSDQVMTSRMLVAGWPTLKDLPVIVVAIELSSVEEATKFESQLNGALLKYLPPVTPQGIPDAAKLPEERQQATNEKPAEPPAPVPSFYLKRVDSLLLISPTPVELKKLRPTGSKPFSEDVNFRMAYNRFSSEPVFVFVDFKAIEKESEERRKYYEEEAKKAQEAQKAIQEKQKAEAEQPEVGDEATVTEIETGTLVQPSPEPSPAEAAANAPLQAELSNAVGMLWSTVFGGAPDMPDALGVGFSPDNESFDVRALMIDSSGETSDPIPFFAGLKLGGPISPESPGLLPADSEFVVTFSLDMAQIHARMSAYPPPTILTTRAGGHKQGGAPEVLHASAPEVLEGPLSTIERLLKIKVKDDLLPVLGSEISVSLPVTEFNMFGPPRSGPQPAASQTKADGSKPAPRSPFFVISLRDREGMRRLMPKILEGFIGKAATSLAQTERREDTELVSYANMFAYGLVGNFLVLSPDAATTRHVVDSYLKGETLSADVHFKNYTRWQPRQVQGQVYVSPAFAESYRTWANSPTARISEEARAFLTRISMTPQPVTYAVSNDGLGTLHELHIPKSLIMLTMGGLASAENPPQTVKNERMAMSVLWSISGAERQYKEEKGTGYAALEELITEKKLSKETMEQSGYKFEIRLTSDGYEISAVPIEYGKTGKLSFFMDHQGHGIRGADHGGGPASASDPPMYW